MDTANSIRGWFRAKEIDQRIKDKFEEIFKAIEDLHLQIQGGGQRQNVDKLLLDLGIRFNEGWKTCCQVGLENGTIERGFAGLEVYVRNFIKKNPGDEIIRKIDGDLASVAGAICDEKVRRSK